MTVAIERPPLVRGRHQDIALVVASAAALATGTAVILIAVSMWLKDEYTLPVIQPLVVLVIVGAAFFGVLFRREKAAPFLSLGGFAGAMIMLYSIYPLAIFVINGGRYWLNNDIRLFMWPPVPAEISIFGWWYVIFFVSFAVAYLAVAPTGPRLRPLVIRTLPRGLLIIILFSVVTLQAYLTGTRYVFNLGGDDYLQAYVKVQSLPLLIRQFYVHLAEMWLTLLILMLCVFFSQYAKYRVWIVLMVIFQVFVSLRVIHARSELFMFLVALMVLYHNVVRKIPSWFAAAAGVVLVGAFIVMAVMRTTTEDRLTPAEVARGNSEFEAIMANAYDLRSIKGASGVLLSQPAVYLSDFANVLPQQLVPFNKRNKAEWFVNTYYPQAGAAGAGYAFGVLSEAVTGFGWIELLVRGAVVGLGFGLIQRRFSRGTVSVWQMTFYVWMVVLSYQVLRNTTFFYFTFVEYSFLVPVIFLRTIHYLLSTTKTRLHALVRPA